MPSLAEFKRTPGENAADIEVAERERWREEADSRSETRRVAERAIEASLEKGNRDRDYDESRVLRADIERRIGAPASSVAKTFLDLDTALHADPVGALPKVTEFLQRLPLMKAGTDAPIQHDPRTHRQRFDADRLKTHYPEGSTGRVLADAVLASQQEARDAAGMRKVQDFIKAANPNVTVKGTLQKIVETLDATAEKDPQQVAHKWAMASGLPTTPEQVEAYRQARISNIAGEAALNHWLSQPEFKSLAGREDEIITLIRQGKIKSNGNVREGLKQAKRLLGRRAK